MRRTTPLTIAALLGLTLLTPTTAATAAGETCRGEAATIVGTGSTIAGTEGRDVIVTGTAGVVDALGGDDLICVTPTRTSSNLVSVDAGSGDDVVDTTGTRAGYYVTTTLGAGADSFAGGTAHDSVFAGERGAPRVDTELDRIDTGEGDDDVSSGSPGAPNHDAVTLGAGTDLLVLHSPSVAADAVLAGGTGSDSLRLDVPSGDVKIDMKAGTVAGTTGAGTFTSLEDVTVEIAGNGTVIYLGTDFNDVVRVHPRGGVPTLDLRMRAGHDEIVVEPATISPDSRFDGAAGADRLVAASRTERLGLDLRKDRLEIGDVSIEADDLDHAFLMAPEVVLAGDARDNELAYTGCDATLRGGQGDDSLAWRYDSVFESYEFRCTGDVTMSGGDGRDFLGGSASDDRLIGGRGHDDIEGRGGDDRIRGGPGHDTMDGGEGRDDINGGAGDDVLKGRAADDRLIGGAGRDRADGSLGRDLCRAERTLRCER